MSKYIMRLDDAAPHAKWENWERIEQLFDFFDIRPLVGVIPNCRDAAINCFKKKADFWDKVYQWQDKGWIIALHGYDHVYISYEGGIYPVHPESEFAGISLEIQREKIREGIRIFKDHGIEPKVFFAPSHTMDLNTIQALKMESEIRTISDTIANDAYNKWEMTFVPQQSGRVRKLPLKTVTFCYHPNTMSEDEFLYLEKFLKENKEKFVDFPVMASSRKPTIYDWVLTKLYFNRR